MDATRLTRYLQALRENAGFTPTLKVTKADDEQVATITSPTIVQRFRNGRLHGPLTGRFGTVLFFYNGVHIPPRFWKHPEEVTIEDVFTEKNAEVRRVALEIHGLSKIVKHKNYKLLHRDEETGAELFEFNLMNEFNPIRYVKVFNSTPEPDGTYREFFLCVSSTEDIKTCKEAIAWTFRRKAADYHPVEET